MVFLSKWAVIERMKSTLCREYSAKNKLHARFALPLLQASYPVYIFLTLMNLADRFIPNRFYYIGGTIGTLLVSTLDVIAASQTLIDGSHVSALAGFLQKLPLANFGIAWVIPAAAGALIAGLAYEGLHKRG